LLKEITAANGVGTIFDYDKNGRLTAMDYDSAAGEIKHYAITYDDANNIRILNDNQYVYDVQNRLTHAWLKGEFTVETEGTEGERYGIRDEDYFGEKILNTLDEEVANLTLTELDYSARSIGVDLGGIYPVSKIDLTSTLAGTRITEDQIRVFISPDNLNYQEVTDLQVTKGTGPTDSFEIHLVSTIETRYIKIKTDYDDRDKDFNFVPAETVATFKNSLSSLIRVFYTYDTREEEYVYDVGGNRVRESITTRGTGTRQYHYYPNTNRLMTDGIYAYNYDPNGNIIAKGTHILINSETAAVPTVGSDYWDTTTGSIDGIEPAHEGTWWTYSYDLLNRLTKVHKNGEEAAAYSYNAEGLRIRKQKNSQSTWYAFSLSGKLIYKEKEEEQTFNNYIYTNGQLFAMEEGTLNEVETTRSYLHTDHLGSVVAATNIDGDIVWANDYTPFGETTGASELNDEFAKFTGKEMDPDTGLYYSNARWYDPELGRFITSDPIRSGLNWYAYCSSNPLKYVDPTGLRAVVAEDNQGNCFFSTEDYLESLQKEIESYNPKIENASSIGEAQEMEQKQLELMGEYNRNTDYTSADIVPNSSVSSGGEFMAKMNRYQLKDGTYLSKMHKGIDRVNGTNVQTPLYTRVLRVTRYSVTLQVVGTDREIKITHSDRADLNQLVEGALYIPNAQITPYPKTINDPSISGGIHIHIEEWANGSILNPDTHRPVPSGTNFYRYKERLVEDGKYEIIPRSQRSFIQP
ncbi:MAG: hypothetical protein KAU17_15440, partial [Spirochaetales bacterium]|nr:hypothetical protein [Spirochaetales bacterium]